MSQGDIRFNPKEADLFLKEYFAYYNTLDEHWKQVFVQRLLLFVQKKNFIGQHGFELNNKVKAIISASAVQLTLGLDEWQIRYFDTILLFPKDFFNQITGLGVKGETNLSGYMSFSWTSFIQGYKVSNDNLNLGLHEFTHALRFNSIRGERSDYFFENYFPKWYSYAKNEFLRIKAGKPSIFRKYGGTNINEFLSVVVEHFFESPQQFMEEQPLLYSATAILLNQKTNGRKTSLNIRQDELKKIVSHVPITVNIPEPFFLRNNGALTSFIFLCTAIVTLPPSGLFSFPFLFLLILAGLYYLIFDFRYGKAIVGTGKITLVQGYLLFRNRKKYTVEGHRLVKAQFFNTGEKEQTLVLTFFDEHGLFNEVSARAALSELEKQKLSDELEKNYTWVLQG